MKKLIKNSERGQAIILIVFAIVGLIGMTALTVDGGMAYSDHRHAQNAADTAAFAAARSKIRDEDWKAAALNLASLNSYTDTDATSASSSTKVNVEVYSCTDTASSCGTYAGNDQYVQVLITSTINTFFGKVIGVSQVTNRVNSVAQAKPGAPDPTSFGNAMESLMPGCSGAGWNKDPYKITGNGTTTVTGSGVKVNSNCDHYALTQGGGGALFDTDGSCVVGTVDPSAAGNISPAPTHDCTPSPERQWPNISCDINGNGVEDASEMGHITMLAGLLYGSTPGYYDGDFPTGASGQLLMQQGTYCIGGDFTVNSTLNVSTDYNQNNAFDYATEGVLIYVKNGRVTLNGSSELHLHAISDPTAPIASQNLLFYLPPGNQNTVTITGNTNSDFTGSIWAPSALITLQGNGGTTVNSQVVGYSIEVAGGAGLTVNYNENQNAVSMSPANIQLSQ